MTKPTKWSVCPVKTQISQGICLVWSESSQCAQWVAEDPKFLYTDSEDSDWADTQADLSLCWAHVILLVLSFQQCGFTRVMCLKHADGMTHSVDWSDCSEAVWSGLHCLCRIVDLSVQKLRIIWEAPRHQLTMLLCSDRHYKANVVTLIWYKHLRDWWFWYECHFVVKSIP